MNNPYLLLLIIPAVAILIIIIIIAYCYLRRHKYAKELEGFVLCTIVSKDGTKESKMVPFKALEVDFSKSYKLGKGA